MILSSTISILFMLLLLLAAVGVTVFVMYIITNIDAIRMRRWHKRMERAKRKARLR